MPSKICKINPKDQKSLTKREPSENVLPKHPKTMHAKMADNILTLKNQNVLTPQLNNIDDLIQKVQSTPILITLYLEFKKIVSNYDDEVRKKLTPLMVNVLECINTAYQVNKDYNFKFQLLEADNKQIEEEYIKIKRLKNITEQKFSSYKEVSEKERKDLACRLEGFQNKARLFELRHTNIMEYARLIEEQERQIRREYDQIQIKYANLFRAYVIHTEKIQLPELLDKDFKLIKEVFARKADGLPIPMPIGDVGERQDLINREKDYGDLWFSLEDKSTIITKESPSFLISKLKKHIADLQNELRICKRANKNDKVEAEDVRPILKSKRVYTKADMAKHFLIKNRFYIGLQEPLQWSQILNPSQWIVNNFAYHILVLPEKLWQQ